MDTLILLGLLGGAYYLYKRLETVQSAPSVLIVKTVDFEFSLSAPIPLSTEEANFGKIRFAFNITVSWKNIDTMWDVIAFYVSDGLTTVLLPDATFRPLTKSGTKTLPVTVEAVPGSRQRIIGILKNIETVEYIKATDYQTLTFGMLV